MSFESITTIGIFIVSQVVILFATISTLKGDARVMQSEMKAVKEELGKLSNVLVELAKQDGRINRVEDRQMAQGMRLDDVERRVNKYVDNHIMPS